MLIVDFCSWHNPWRYIHIRDQPQRTPCEFRTKPYAGLFERHVRRDRQGHDCPTNQLFAIHESMGAEYGTVLHTLKSSIRTLRRTSTRLYTITYRPDRR